MSNLVGTDRASAREGTIRGAGRSRLRVLAAVVTALLGSVMMAAPATAAETPALPGMCAGRTDPAVVVTAHATGRPVSGAPKFVLNLATDEVGHPAGVLILGTGANRLIVTDWCRLWSHIPGQAPEHGEDPSEPMEGATIVHAVGIGVLRDGMRVLVRTDLRATDEGNFYRLRYKPLGAGEPGDAEPSTVEPAEEGHDDGWTRFPAEGWSPLTIFKVRSA